MDRCYGGSPQEQAAYCGLITRDPNYGTATQRYTITNVDMPLQNLSSYKVEGWDLGILYKLPETSIGQFTISPDGTYLSKWDTKSTEDAPLDGRAGRYLDQIRTGVSAPTCTSTGRTAISASTTACATSRA